jgi:hypothetical protein
MIDFAPGLKRAVHLPALPVGAGEKEEAFFCAGEKQSFHDRALI